MGWLPLQDSILSSPSVEGWGIGLVPHEGRQCLAQDLVNRRED